MPELKNELEVVMEEAFSDSSKVEIFYSQLLASELYVLTEGAPDHEGRRMLEKDTNVGIVNFLGAEGEPFVPVFTSLPELQRSIEQDFGYIGMDGWNLFSLIKGSDVIINPASDCGLLLKAEEIAEILHYFGVHQLTVEKDTQVLIGQPAVDPFELKKALAEVFRRDGRVSSAYLCLMMRPDTGEQSFAVGVVFRPGEEYREIFNIAGPAASKYLPKGYTLDFFVIDENNPDGVAGSLLNDGDRFFTAKMQG